jgi:hypothetical protein
MDADRLLALETISSTSLHKPTLELKSLVQDRRLIHVLVLAWVTIIWHDAKEEYVKDKAKEIAKTLTCKRIMYCKSKPKLTSAAKQKLENKLYGKSKRKGLIS